MSKLIKPPIDNLLILKQMYEELLVLHLKNYKLLEASILVIKTSIKDLNKVIKKYE